jgi:hypothetical protein
MLVSSAKKEAKMETNGRAVLDERTPPPFVAFATYRRVSCVCNNPG